MTTTPGTAQPVPVPSPAPPLALPAPHGACPYDPPPAYTEAARERTVTRGVLPGNRPCWLVTGYQEVRTVLSDARFSADVRRPGFPFFAPGRRRLAAANPSFLRMDDPEHARLRRMVTGDFLVRRIEALRPGIQRIVDDAVDRLLAQGSPADLVADFALPVPSLVICLLLGVPYEDHDRFQRLSRTLLDSTRTTDQLADAQAELNGYLIDLTAAKRKAPGDDILSRLALRQDIGLADAAATGMLLLVAGHETTANMTAISTLLLLRHPEQAAALAADPSGVPRAVEELLRFTTIIQTGLPRVAATDVELGGEHIRAGEGVLAMVSTANRDEELFGGADRGPADELDLSRDARRHLAFGFGVHQCLGQPLARAELQIALATLLRRLPGLRLAVPESEVEFRPETLVYGVRSLPVAW